MRRCFIAGNWKMNLCRAESTALAGGIASALGDTPGVDVAVCPPSIYLDAVATTLDGSPVSLGAQDVYFEEQGAFTGELSPSMLCDIGCRYVILGHSERRHVLGEDDTLVNCKLHAALNSELLPIVCVGETIDDRRSGRTAEVVAAQFTTSLAGLTAEQMAITTIAYEPVWAIGTGEVATPEQAQEVHADLRSLLEKGYNSDIASLVRIQYGGSVNAENAAALLSQPDIDGALVGGASLAVESFLGIIQQAPVV